MTAELAQSSLTEPVEDQPTPDGDGQIPLESLVHVALSPGADRVSMVALNALNGSDVVLSYRNDDINAKGWPKARGWPGPLRVARI